MGIIFFSVLRFTQKIIVSEDDLQIPKPAGPPRQGSDSGKKNFRSPSKAGPAKKKCIHKIGKTFNCRVTWAWSEMVNLYNRQIKIQPMKKKIYMQHCQALGPLSARRAPVILLAYLISRRHWKWLAQGANWTPIVIANKGLHSRKFHNCTSKEKN